MLFVNYMVYNVHVAQNSDLRKKTTAHYYILRHQDTLDVYTERRLTERNNKFYKNKKVMQIR